MILLGLCWTSNNVRVENRQSHKPRIAGCPYLTFPVVGAFLTA